VDLLPPKIPDGTFFHAWKYREVGNGNWLPIVDSDDARPIAMVLRRWDDNASVGEHIAAEHTN
jgi:hypothetical protein